MNTCPNVAPADGGVTVMADGPLCPSLVAVIVAEPATTPLTRPLELTVATELSLLDHVTIRPVSGFPFASFGVAVSWTVWPTGRFADAGVTVTELTATPDTVMLEVPLCPSLVAVIVAEPDVPPVTSPLPSTLATAVLLLDQVTVRPVNGFPLASFGVAVSWTVWPTCTVADAGLTVTELTGTTATALVSYGSAAQPSAPWSKSTCQRIAWSPPASTTGPPTTVPWPP